jgi:decaprenyl-phosphate phosphoribosyltransferase
MKSGLLKKLNDFMIKIINLLRPTHYVKNIFIFLPLFFSGQITLMEKSVSAIIAFVAFSLSASAIYIFNDLRDIKNDKMHPVKKLRPLASGLVSKKLAFFLMIILLCISLSLMMTVSIKSLIILIIYILLNLAYSLGLKRIPIIDITIISIGFVLRLFVGSFAYNVDLNTWILIMTFLLALFIALGKRRDDVLILKKTKKKMRKSIDGYNLKLIDSSMLVLAATTVVTYIQFSISSESIIKFNENLYLTTIFIIFGTMRYLQLVFVHNTSGDPVEIILNDNITKINLLIWLSSFIWIIY